MKPGEPLDPSGLEVLVIFVHLYHTMSNPYVSHRWDMCLWHEKKTDKSDWNPALGVSCKENCFLSKAVSVSALNINFGSIWLDMFHRRNEPTVNLNLQRPKCPKRSPTSHPGDIWISNQTTVAELLPASKALGPSPPAAPSVARPEALGSSSSPPPPPAPVPPSVAALSGWSPVVFEAAPGAVRRESWWPKWGSPGI